MIKKMKINQKISYKFKYHKKRIKKKKNSKKTKMKNNNLKKKMKTKVSIIKRTFILRQISLIFMKAQDSPFHSWSIDM